MIESFEIQNYRLFRQLKIEKLSRVNLITGKNNVGKTALLEAVRFFSETDKINCILNILKSRGELSSNIDLSIFYLFNGHFNNPHEIINISDNINKLSIETILFTEEWNKERTSMNRRIVNSETDTNIPTKRGLLIKENDTQKIYHLEQPINNELSLSDYKRLPETMKRCLYISSSGLDSKTSYILWDNIVLTPSKNYVINNILLMSPEIEDIALIVLPENKELRQFRTKKENNSVAELLTSEGEGTRRLFDITLALINAQNGILLIDEIENGIHYSIHQKLWEIILDFAEKLNVQVFATTHSWDCIDGFQRALNDFHDPSQGQLIRLSKRNDDIITTSSDARELAIAVRENIEVR